MAYEKKWDWESIRLEYIMGELIISEDGTETRKPYTIKRLSEKSGIPFSTLLTKSQKEKWSTERARLDTRLKRKLTENKVTQLLGESIISATHTLNQLGNINKIIDAYLQPYVDLTSPDTNKNLNIRTTITEDGYSNVEVLSEQDLPKISPRDIKDVVSIIKDVYSLTKSILGDDDLQNVAEEIQIRDKAKKLKGNPKTIDERLDALIREREKVKSSLNNE